MMDYKLSVQMLMILSTTHLSVGLEERSSHWIEEDVD